RRFVARMGRSFRDYLSQHRLERARRLLEDGAGNVTEAAFSAGYSSVSQFSRAFRRHFGKPPSAVARRPAREV
ncbi:MAG: helix-turn-helix transcriptional regulator, partial [Opitutales bacterium]